MGQFIYYNPNPCGKSVGDCTVRAIAKALEQDWETTYIGLSLQGLLMGDMPNADNVWGAYLRLHGFHRMLLPNDLPDFYTVADFARDNPDGTFVLSMPGRHVVVVIDGNWLDSWDSGREEPVYYWKREDD